MNSGYRIGDSGSGSMRPREQGIRATPDDAIGKCSYEPWKAEQV